MSSSQNFFFIHSFAMCADMCSTFSVCDREERRSAGYGHDSAVGGYGSYASSWPHDSYSSQLAYGNHGNNQR
jgi:hypothetical protein